MQLSKSEDWAYGKLKKSGLAIFRIKDMQLALGLSSVRAYNLVKALKRKGAIEKVGRGYFAFKGTNEYSLSTEINSPSYISFWSALNYYGFSDNAPKKIFVASTRHCGSTGNFKYVTLSRKKFFGYARVGDITIAEKEKAIIDSLAFPKYAGGMREIYGCLKKAMGEIDVNKMISYAMKTDSKAVARRLGYFLESAGYCKNGRLNKNIGRGYELLDPSLKRKNHFNKRWLLDVNW